MTKKTKPKTKKEKLLDQLRICELVEKWPERLEALKTRENDPLKESEFCDKHGFNRAQFNRNKNLTAIPEQESVDLVEIAFKKEKV